MRNYLVQVPALFAGRSHALIQLLDQPPELRHAGFDISVGVETKIVKGRLRCSLNPARRVLELWRDGVLLFASEASRHLCWGTGNAGEPLMLNPLALAETTYLFAEMTNRIREFMKEPQDTNDYVLGLQRMSVNGQRALLFPGPNRARLSAFPADFHRLETDDLEDIRMTVPAPTDPRIVAYGLRRELYARFEFDEDAIPYTTEVNGQPATDPQKIIEDGKEP